MMIIGGFAAAIAAVAGYVKLRNRRSGSIVDASDSRKAIVQADRQAVQDLRQDEAWGGLHRI
jgi:hypothetical protein